MTHRASPLLRLLLIIGAPLFAWLAVSAWAFASPVGSSPDDNFHLAAIWCGLGDRPGLCEAVDDGPSRAIPASIPQATCYAYYPDQDASCWEPDQGGLQVVERANVDGLYPRLFYAAMSVFASTDVQNSVLVMRLVNAAFLIGILTAVFHALPRTLRTPLVISTIGAVAPLGLFLLGSNNPSSWALISAATVWICVYGSTVTTDRRRVLLAALAVLGAVIGAGARADAAIFAVFGAAVGLFLGLRSVRDIRRQVVAIAAFVTVGVVSSAFYFSATQGGAALAGLDPSAPPLTLAQHVANFIDVPLLWVGALGQSMLGWLDTTLPAVVWIAGSAVYCGAVFIGLRGAGPRRIVGFGAAVAAMWIVPFVTLVQANATVGMLVQSRYILPLMIITLGVASLRSDAEAAWDGPRYWLAAALLTGSITLALRQNIRRYTTGLDAQAVDPGQGAMWWWAGVPSPLFVWAVGVLSCVALLALLWTARRVSASPDDAAAGLVATREAALPTPSPSPSAP